MDNLKDRPLGLIPQHIWLEHVLTNRIRDVFDAIKRYERSGIKVPQEWWEEYTELHVKLYGVKCCD